MRQGDLLRRITEVKDAELARLAQALQVACSRVDEARQRVVEHRARHADLEQSKRLVRGAATHDVAHRPLSALERQCEHRYEVALVASIVEAAGQLAVAESELDRVERAAQALRAKVELLTAQQLHARNTLKRMDATRRRAAELALEEDALEAWQVRPRCN